MGTPFILGPTEARPLIARLRQHVTESGLGFTRHTPSKGLSCSLLPFAVRHINDYISQQTTAEMDWCRVVRRRGLCRPLDDTNGVSNKLFFALRTLNGRWKCKHLSCRERKSSAALETAFEGWERMVILFGHGAGAQKGPKLPRS